VCPRSDERDRERRYRQRQDHHARSVVELHPDEERLITIEDAAELWLAKPHVIALEARPANVQGRGEVTVRDLVRNALSMRPDRIIVGEVRGGEALDICRP